jgi:hypothetical protein
MRAAAVASILLVAGCGQSGEQHNAAGAAEPGLECATDGASDYGAGCTIERKAAARGTVLTLRSPTGSFRRLRVVNGAVAAADGAEPARVIGGDARRIEVAVGRDRYRIPRKDLR